SFCDRAQIATGNKANRPRVAWQRRANRQIPVGLRQSALLALPLRGYAQRRRHPPLRPAHARQKQRPTPSPPPLPRPEPPPLTHHCGHQDPPPGRRHIRSKDHRRQHPLSGSMGGGGEPPRRNCNRLSECVSMDDWGVENREDLTTAPPSCAEPLRAPRLVL